MAIFPTNSHASILVSLLAFSNLNPVHAGVSLDPVKNFCRRVGHSSVFKNGTLYINGGLQTYVDFGASGQQDTSTITTGINENLIIVDMGGSWDWQTNVSISQKSRHESGSVEGMSWPVNVYDGALFGGLDTAATLYMFGGTTMDLNQSFPYFLIPPTEQYAMWTYDIDGDLWNAFDTSGSDITIPSWGANTEAPDQGLAFYLGGRIDGGTAVTTQYLGEEVVGLGGMVVIDTASSRVKNLTVEDTVKSNRQGAGMVYVDNFGDAGVLVLVGGYSDADGFLAMDDISIFDVSSTDLSEGASSDKNIWYQQKASGDIPSARTDFCLVAASSQDNSSTSIYLYGGRSNGTIFDDIYVLSVPSFTWVKVFVGEDARWSVTCHFIPPRQMITVGGGGKSTNISEDCDWEQKSLAVLDLSTIGWGSVYDANASPFEVAEAVVKAIGGGTTGGASKIDPSDGWQEDGLAQLFTIRTVASDPSLPPNVTSSATPSPTASQVETANNSSTSSISISGGAIAGIAIGIVVLVVAVGAGLFFWLRSRRHRKRSTAEVLLEKDSLPSYSTAASMNTAELVATPHASELSAKQSPAMLDGENAPSPIEKDAGGVPGRYPAQRQNGPAEME